VGRDSLLIFFFPYVGYPDVTVVCAACLAVALYHHPSPHSVSRAPTSDHAHRLHRAWQTAPVAPPAHLDLCVIPTGRGTLDRSHQLSRRSDGRWGAPLANEAAAHGATRPVSADPCLLTPPQYAGWATRRAM